MVQLVRRRPKRKFISQYLDQVKEDVHLFICGSFNDAVSSSEYIVSNDASVIR
jgi:hypothetical protein